LLEEGRLASVIQLAWNHGASYNSMTTLAQGGNVPLGTDDAETTGVEPEALIQEVANSNGSARAAGTSFSPASCWLASSPSRLRGRTPAPLRRCISTGRTARPGGVRSRP
jgi:hypothetical protein